MSKVARALARGRADETTPAGATLELPQVTITPQDLDRLRRLVHLATVAVSEMNLWLANLGDDPEEVTRP